MATWNINGLAPNKHEVEVFLYEHKVDILLLSEAHCTLASSIKIRNYQCYYTVHPDGTGHAGTAVLIKKCIKHHILPDYSHDYLQATTVAVEDRTGYLYVSAIYSPPKHKISEHMYTNFFKTLGNRVVIGGDWNAKHITWGSRLTNTKGRQLKLSIDANNMSTITTAEPTYWPTDPARVPDLVDFVVTKGLSKHYFKAESCYDGSSDHTPVLLTMSTKIIQISRPETLYNNRTDWVSFRDYIEDNIQPKVALKTAKEVDDATRHITSLIQNACWKSTPTPTDRKEQTNYPISIKKAVLEKRRLRRI